MNNSQTGLPQRPKLEKPSLPSDIAPSIAQTSQADSVASAKSVLSPSSQAEPHITTGMVVGGSHTMHPFLSKFRRMIPLLKHRYALVAIAATVLVTVGLIIAVMTYIKLHMPAPAPSRTPASDTSTSSASSAGVVPSETPGADAKSNDSKPATTKPGQSASSAPGSTGSNTTGAPTGTTNNTPSHPDPAPSSPYGVPATITLKSSGSITASANQIIENLDITGMVFVPDGAQNVIIRNCRFNGTGNEYFAVNTANTASVTIDHVTFHGAYNDSFVAGQNITMTNSDLYAMTEDAVKVDSNTTYKNNYIHDFHPSPGSHADGMQIMQRVENVLIQNNIIVASCDPNYACISSPIPEQDMSVNAAFIFSDDIPGGPINGLVTIDGNTLSGGGFTVYLTLPNVNTRFTNNKFIRNSYAYDAVEGTAWATVWSNNTFTDNGQVIPMPGTPH